MIILPNIYIGLGSFILLMFLLNLTNFDRYQPGMIISLFPAVFFLGFGIYLRNKIKLVEKLRSTGKKIITTIADVEIKKNWIGQTQYRIYCKGEVGSSRERIFVSDKFVINPALQIDKTSLIEVFIDPQNNTKYFVNFLSSIK